MPIFVRLAAVLFTLAASWAHGQNVVSPASAQVYSGGSLNSVAVQPDGKVIIAGGFEYVGGLPRRNIARLNTDGTVDAGWNPGADNFVNSVVVDGGFVYMAGGFSNAGGQPRRGVARIPIVGNGAADAAWNPDATLGGETAAVFTLLAGNGVVYIGGNFDRVGAVTNRGLVRVSASGAGAADTSWVPSCTLCMTGSMALDGSGNLYIAGALSQIHGQFRGALAKLSTAPGAALDPWNPGGINVYAIALDGLGNLYVGGQFGFVGGQSRANLARLSASGAGDADSWQAPVVGGGVHSLALDGNGGLLVGGVFTSVSGLGRTNLARVLASSGAADAAFTANTDGPVSGLTVRGAGLFVAGSFAIIAGQQRPGFAGLVAASGAVDNSWTVPRSAGLVRALATDASGRVIVGGIFTTVEGGASRPNLARFNPDGSLDPSWSPAPNGAVNAIAIANTGEIFVGGNFTTIGGQARNRIARLDPFGSGPADGTWNPNANAEVHALALNGNGATIYVGGSFTTVGGQSRSAVARLSTTGTGAADAWAPNATGGNPNHVRALAVQGVGDVFLGGDFATVGGVSRSNIARVNASGATLTWSADANDTVHALALDGSGLYAGGTFTTIGGQARQGLARLATTLSGGADASWNPGTNGTVNALALDGQGWMYVGGFFTTIGSQSRGKAARLVTASGAPDLWDGNVSGSVAAITLDVGKVWLGGSFTSIAGSARASLATLSQTAGTPPGITSASIVAFAVGTFGSFTVTATGSPAPTFSITAGSLPSGLGINSSTGVISGTPAAGTAGSYPLQLTASNANGSVNQAFTLNVVQVVANQTIDFAPIADRTYTKIPFTLSATASSGLAVEFTSATPAVCRVTGTSLAMLTAGLCGIYADQPGNASFNAAPQVLQTFNIAPTAPSKASVSSVAQGYARAIVSFTPPDSDGGTPITSYTATCAPVAAGASSSASGPTSPLTVTGLTPGNLYTCAVVANNAQGSSAPAELPPPPAGAPAMTSNGIDFGGQSMGTTSPPIPLQFRNNTAASVTITGITVPAPFVATHLCVRTLHPGESCTVQVAFTPAVANVPLNGTAPAQGNLVLTTSASAPLTLGLSGVAEKSLVAHYYNAILNREPDSAGKTFWGNEAARLTSLGVNINETWFVMAGYFFNSAEYASQVKNDTQFVTDLYNTFFNRGPDSGGLNYWVGQIQAGLPREVVLFSFMFSNEFRTFTQAIFGNTAARAEVDMVVDFFRGLLNRLPDTASFNYWLGQLRTAQCQGAGPVYTKVDEISAAFMFNTEFNNRNRNNTQFATDMYYSFLRRGGDVAGVQYWINQLNTGTPRNNVRYYGFLNSAEFGARVQAVIAAGCVP